MSYVCLDIIINTDVIIDIPKKYACNSSTVRLQAIFDLIGEVIGYIFLCFEENILEMNKLARIKSALKFDFYKTFNRHCTSKYIYRILCNSNFFSDILLH